MTFFTIVLRILLIYWILSILIKWFGRLSFSNKNSDKIPNDSQNPNAPLNNDFTGKIEDAEFEEMDSE